MAGGKSGSVVDWHWLQQEMPIGTDPYSKRARNILFAKLDVNDDGLLSTNEAITGFEKFIRTVRGYLDVRPIFKTSFQVTREAVDPVIPIGIDFMERNQFRILLVCMWLYIRIWEYLYFTCGQKRNATAKLQDLEHVVKILQEFGYPDPERFGVFARQSFLQDASAEIPFDKFVQVCLKFVLPELSEIDGEAERASAIREVGKFNPALLSKPKETGSYKTHSIETGQMRMTGFVYKKMCKAASESALLKPSDPVVTAGTSPQASPKSLWASQRGPWQTQYAMQFTQTKFHPKARQNPHAHPSQTERSLPFGHRRVEATALQTAGAAMANSYSDSAHFKNRGVELWTPL